MIPQIIYAAWCILFALANAKAIGAGVKILHGINGFIHLSVIIYFSFAIHWIIGLQMLFIGRLFFDIALNLFRGLPVTYVSEDPKSIIDRLEILAFSGNGLVPKIV